MIRILLDECLPVKLVYRFQECSSDFHVSIVTGYGWSGTKNGALLEKARVEFDVLVTMDQGLPYQQNISKYSISIIAFKATTNRYKDLLDFIGDACELIEKVKVGKYYSISHKVD